jgi:cell shape-determining protein MreC
MKVVLSLILAKPNQTPYDTLIIDRGTNDGISVDDLVFAHGDVLIGFIESVDKSSAKVLMYSTPGNISQVVYGNSGKYFNARGAGNGTLEVEVSREIEVAVGDQFFYPGLDNTLVGVVEKVHFDPRDSFKKVIIKSPVNIQEERWVEVRI